MTREEAIFKLKDLLIPTTLGSKCIGEFDKPAINMAIKALEQEPVIDKIRAEIERIEISGQIDENSAFIRSGEHIKTMVLDIINKYKAETEEE